MHQEGGKPIFRLAMGKERKTRDLDQVKCNRDEESKILVHKRDIKDEWKNYFHKLFNEGYEILPNSNRLDTREED